MSLVRICQCLDNSLMCTKLSMSPVYKTCRRLNTILTHSRCNNKESVIVSLVKSRAPRGPFKKMLLKNPKFLFSLYRSYALERNRSTLH